MAHDSARFQHLGLAILMVLSLASAPLSGLGQINPEDAQMLCLKTMQVAKEQRCCNEPADDVPAPHTTRSESNTVPCGHPDECSCCTRICCTVIVGPIEESDHSLIEHVIDMVPMSDQTPDDSHWRDPLLRPPIC